MLNQIFKGNDIFTLKTNDQIVDFEVLTDNSKTC